MRKLPWYILLLGLVPLVHCQEEENLNQQMNETTGSCFSTNLGFVGNPLVNISRENNKFGPVETPELCQDQCKLVTGCNWFNWEENTGNCWLMEFKGRAKNMARVVSGPVDCQPTVPCIQRNILYIGHPLNRVKRNGTWSNNIGRVNTEEECQRFCSETLGCKWFNWGRDSLCWLKTSRGELQMERREFGTSSGPAKCKDIKTVIQSHEYESAKPGWGYGDLGTKAWTAQFPKCGGVAQSPVNLVCSTEEIEISRDLNFTNYDQITAENTQLQNNGHSVELEILSITPSTAILSGGPLTRSYQLLQLHFHWGENDTLGSEHAVDGAKFPLEVHLVHMTTDLDWEEESAIDPVDVKDGLAVTSFLFEITDKPNHKINPIINSLKAIKEKKSKTKLYKQKNKNKKKKKKSNALSLANFKVSSLINPVISGPYYSYSGSLTTPTCNEVVQWIVFKETLSISSAQMEQFRQLEDGHGDPMLNNYRPLQDLGARKVAFGVGQNFKRIDDE